MPEEDVTSSENLPVPSEPEQYLSLNVIKNKPAAEAIDFMLELGTGVGVALVDDRGKLVKSGGHILQAALNGNFRETVARELKSYIDDGRIKEDYVQHPQFMESLIHLNEALDGASFDLGRIELMKKIILVMGTESVSDRDNPIPLELMKKAKQIDSSELRILNATWEVSKKTDKDFTASMPVSEWFKIIATNSGLNHIELVEMHENALVEKRLISPRIGQSQDHVGIDYGFRLTSLALSLMEFVENYEPPVS